MNKFNYGDKIEQQLVKLSLERRALDTIRQNNNLIYELASVKQDNSLSNSETTVCDYQVHTLKKEVYETERLLHRLRKWRRATYN